MIFSYDRFDVKTRIVSKEDRKSTADDEYICIIAYQRKRLFTNTFGITTTPMENIPEKTKDIVLRQLFAGYRNTRDNLLQLSLARFNIWKIAYYQKNERVIEPAINITGCVIGLIPEEAITPKMIRKAIKNDILSVKYMSEDMLTHEVIRFAISTDTDSFRYIPEHLMRKKHIIFALKRSITVVNYILQYRITTEMIQVIISALSSPDNAYMLSDIPHHLMTPDFLRVIVLKNPYVIFHIPEHLRSDELRSLAYNRGSDCRKFW